MRQKRGLACANAAVVLGLMLGLARPGIAAEDPKNELGHELALDLGPGGSLELRRIPKGTFTQGSPATEAGREADESPTRSVTITRAFWLGKIPVTRAQFSRFVTETRHVTDAEKGQVGGFGWDGKALVQKKEFTWRNPGFPQKDEDPVVLVTFGDANAFTAWASRKTGRRVRLPTEAEWEYAARAGTSTPWYGATREDEALALGWFKTNSSSSTHPVGTRKPNAFGLFDMSGNVFEWCRDVYAPYPPGDATDPENTTNTTTDPEKRVLRGGSWLREPKRARSAARHRSTPGSRNADYGFRVAADDEEAIAPTAAATPSGDFALASPVGLGSSTAALAGDASASAAVVTPPRASGTGSDAGGGWMLLVAPAAGATMVVGWVLARRKRGGRSGPAVARISTRAQHDGFWMRARGLGAGTRVRYTCIVGGTEVSDLIALDGEETFVQTGRAPTAIRVTEVIPAGVAPSSAAATPRTLGPHPSPASPFAPSASGPAAARISMSELDAGASAEAKPRIPRPPTPEVVHPQSSPFVAHTYISASLLSATPINPISVASVPAASPVSQQVHAPPSAPSPESSRPEVQAPQPAASSVGGIVSVPLTLAAAPVQTAASEPESVPLTPIAEPASAPAPTPPASVPSIPLTPVAEPSAPPTTAVASRLEPESVPLIPVAPATGPLLPSTGPLPPTSSTVVPTTPASSSASSAPSKPKAPAPPSSAMGPPTPASFASTGVLRKSSPPIAPSSPKQTLTLPTKEDEVIERATREEPIPPSPVSTGPQLPPAPMPTGPQLPIDNDEKK